VGCDEGQLGKMIVGTFPQGRQILGPSQINVLIKQDTEIAQELMLWTQATVVQGRIIILPTKSDLLYIQPLYLRSQTSLQIPELKRIIVSDGELVVMDKTIEESLQKLDKKKMARSDRIQRRITGTHEAAPDPSSGTPAVSPTDSILVQPNTTKPESVSKETTPPVETKPAGSPFPAQPDTGKVMETKPQPSVPNAEPAKPDTANPQPAPTQTDTSTGTDKQG
jgi:uncharacterized membrane protein (UPF0182 family)